MQLSNLYMNITNGLINLDGMTQEGSGDLLPNIIQAPISGYVSLMQLNLSHFNIIKATFKNYVNNTANNQTITFPLALFLDSNIIQNTTGLEISATTTGITITSPDNTTQYSGNLIIFGI